MKEGMKKGFGAITGKAAKKSKVQKEEKTIVSPVKKMGRPSHKKEGVEYVKLSASVQKTTRQLLRAALATEFEDDFKTQDELIEAAILYALENPKAFKK